MFFTRLFVIHALFFFYGVKEIRRICLIPAFDLTSRIATPAPCSPNHCPDSGRWFCLPQGQSVDFKKKIFCFLQAFIKFFLFVYFFLCTFVVASARCGCDVIWGWRKTAIKRAQKKELFLYAERKQVRPKVNLWVEHYILKGVTDALFLVESKLPQSNC